MIRAVTFKMGEDSERLGFARAGTSTSYNTMEKQQNGSLILESGWEGSSTQKKKEEELPEECTVSYTKPLFRITVGAIVMLLIDFITTLVFWTIGDPEEVRKSVTNFGFLTSIFDLVVLAFARIVIFVPLYVKLENIHMSQFDSPLDYQLFLVRRVLTASSGAMHFIFFAYTFLKGGFVLSKFIADHNYAPMKPTFYAAMICACVFVLFEFLLYWRSLKSLKMLATTRQRHLFNAQGIEINADGTPVKRQASLARLAKLAKPELPYMSLGMLALLFSTGSQMVAPLFFGMVIDSAQQSMDDLNRTVIIMLIIYGIGALASFLRAWMFELSGQRFVARLRTDVFDAIIKQEVGFFDENRTGELTNRLASDTQVVQNAVTVNISMLTRNSFQIIGSLVLMFILSAKLTAVLLAVVPAIAIGAVQYGKFLKSLRQNFQDELAQANTTAEEAISNIRTVRSFCGEEKMSKEYDVKIGKSFDMGKRIALLVGGFQGGVNIFAFGGITCVLWYGGKLLYENTHDVGEGITAGVLTSFLLFTLNVAMNFALLSSLYGDFMQAVGASTRLFQLLDREPKVKNEGELQEIELKAEIEFEDVCFTYPARPDTEVLKGVSFSVNIGNMVALVGPSGGGKSTIVSLIERFYDVTSGNIKLGGNYIKELDANWFRQKISIVSQEPVLFACSIRDNIMYGKTSTTDEVIEAAKQANAHDFIMSFEDGYDTMVGERGVRLSGGQKQRIAIARALIMNPQILLLDEATSALDAESEYLVQEAIDRAMKGRTVLVIAHRLSTVKSAAQVIVINHGQIVEKGTHRELLRKDGVYKKLVLRQLTSNDDQDSGKETDLTSF